MADSYIEFTVTQIPESYYTGMFGCTVIVQRPDGTSQTIDCTSATVMQFLTQPGTYRIYGVDGTDISTTSNITIDYIKLSELSIIGGSLPFNYIVFQCNGLHSQDQVVLNSNGQSFTSLTLSGNQFTDFSLQTFDVARLDLSPMSTLTSLAVEQNTYITNLVISRTSLQILQPPPSANKIYLSQSKFTTTGIESLLAALDQNGVTNGYVTVKSLPYSTYLTDQAQNYIQSLQSKGWTVQFSTLQESDSSSSSGGGGGSMSDATSVLVMDGMMLALQTPVAGMKGLLINGNYFVPFLTDIIQISDSLSL